MREAYVTTKDAVSIVIATALSKHRPRPPRLWYLEDDGPRKSGMSGAELEAEVDRMALLFPGRVH
jgi:hypothetical protein